MNTSQGTTWSAAHGVPVAFVPGEDGSLFPHWEISDMQFHQAKSWPCPS